MPIDEIFILFILFIIHWTITLFTCFYVFFRKNKRYDYIYFLVASIIVIHWFFFNNECIISILEKNIIYKKNKKPEMQNPSSICYNKNIFFRNIILFITMLLWLYNISYLFLIYKLPIIFVVVLGIIFFIYLVYFRVCDVMGYQLEKYFENDSPPDIIKNDNYINSIYKNKKESKIGFVEIYCLLTSPFYHKLNTNQIYWNDFNNHISIMANNIKNSSTKIDYIIGIESGGAFVAKFLSYQFNINPLYIKASKYDEGKAFENTKIIERSNLNDIYNKNILIVDDQIMSGNTIIVIKNYINNNYKPKLIKTGILYCSNEKKDKFNIDFNGQDFGIYKSPWGWKA